MNKIVDLMFEALPVILKLSYALDPDKAREIVQKLINILDDLEGVGNGEEEGEEKEKL